jgi:hypothetical protein
MKPGITNEYTRHLKPDDEWTSPIYTYPSEKLMKYYRQNGMKLTRYKAIHNDGHGVEIMVGQITRTIRLCDSDIEDYEDITQEEFCKQMVLSTVFLYEIAGIPVINGIISSLEAESEARTRSSFNGFI